MITIKTRRLNFRRNTDCVIAHLSGIQLIRCYGHQIFALTEAMNISQTVTKEQPETFRSCTEFIAVTTVTISLSLTIA